MRRIDYLIVEARRIARNEANTDGSFSITDDEVIQYFNDGQDYFQALIGGAKSTAKMFVLSTVIPMVTGQEGYYVPDRLYMNKGIELVEYSYSGNITDYQRLDKLELFNRNTTPFDWPIGYYRRDRQIFLVGTPATSSSTIRVTYERQIEDLDKRRGMVTTVNGLTSTGFTSIVLDSTADETSTINLTNIDYICIVDKDGNRKAFNIPWGNYNTGTNTFTPATFTFVPGETISVGDYVTFGKWHSTHSALPDEAESYLINYAAECMLHKDSSSDAADHLAKIEAIGDGLIRALGAQTSEVQGIPQYNLNEWY